MLGLYTEHPAHKEQNAMVVSTQLVATSYVCYGSMSPNARELHKLCAVQFYSRPREHNSHCKVHIPGAGHPRDASHMAVQRPLSMHVHVVPWLS